MACRSQESPEPLLSCIHYKTLPRSWAKIDSGAICCAYFQIWKFVPIKVIKNVLTIVRFVITMRYIECAYCCCIFVRLLTLRNKNFKSFVFILKFFTLGVIWFDINIKWYTMVLINICSVRSRTTTFTLFFEPV